MYVFFLALEGIDHEHHRKDRKAAHQAHSRSETAKSLAVARGTTTAGPPLMKRLVPVASQTGSVRHDNRDFNSSSSNAFDGFSGGNDDGEF